MGMGRGMEGMRNQAAASGKRKWKKEEKERKERKRDREAPKLPPCAMTLPFFLQFPQTGLWLHSPLSN